jgi:hypothetical protein
MKQMLLILAVVAPILLQAFTVPWPSTLSFEGIPTPLLISHNAAQTSR